MGLPIAYFKGSQVDYFFNYNVLLSLKIVSILAKRLLKYPFRGLQYTKG